MLPRFKLEYEVRLNEALEALGMGIAFGGGADFSGMGPNLFISEVRHKTFVEVNEEGTEGCRCHRCRGSEVFTSGPFGLIVPSFSLSTMPIRRRYCSWEPLQNRCDFLPTQSYTADG